MEMKGKNGNLVKRGHDISLYLGPGGLFIQLSFNILVVYVFPTALFLVNANMCAVESTCTDCPYIIWSHKCTTCLFPASEEKLINGFFIARERNDSKKSCCPTFFFSSAVVAVPYVRARCLRPRLREPWGRMDEKEIMSSGWGFTLS